jgi:hypothetical protein
MIFTTIGKLTNSLKVFHNRSGCKPATPNAFILFCGITRSADLSVFRKAFVVWDKQIWSSVSEMGRLMNEEREGETDIIGIYIYIYIYIL